MADQDDDTTSTTEDTAAAPAGEHGESAPAPATGLAGQAAEPEAVAGDEDDALAAVAPGAADLPAEDPEPDLDAEPVSRFGAQFSSPEPTAVIARPRRRATRPAAPADPDSVEPAPAAPPAVPAFISFVAPAEAEAPVSRRRSRRPLAESPEEPEDVDVAPMDDEDEPPAPRSRRGRSRRRGATGDAGADAAVDSPADTDSDIDADTDDSDDEGAEDRDEGGAGSRRRRRGRRGRGRGRTGEDGDDAADETGDDAEADEQRRDDADEDSDEAEDVDETGDDDGDSDGDEGEAGSSTRRRRRRRRRGSSDTGGDTAASDDADRPERAGRNGRTTSDDDVKGVAGSTRLEAKRQRRRDGRDTGRRRAPILTEAEFLARREAVDRAMVIRQRGERTQIAVLEDDVLVEHYVTQASATSFAGNVYLGRVQNVLPSMEAAFVDIGKGRNAVLYAGEVNWDAAGLSGKQRSIETAMKSGDKVLVQVTKDPIGHKGARLTQQINLPGRFLVYVPGGSMTGISRKLPDTERQRLKDILKKIVPADAGVIIRTAAEGASEEELTRDVARLQAQWDVIQKKSESSSNAPSLLYGEPDLAIRVIRDVFNEDFTSLVVQGDDAWDTVEAYVAHVSPELVGRLSRYTGEGDVFHDLRIDEQLAKALDRKVWLPSGGSLVIDRTEAMTVVDVNTGKFVGSGGNLEQTVTRNNMEAAEEIVRQLRLRDIGGIIVIDFIDMVLESNRDLVLRRLTECLGRDRTKHQVAEVTSLGLVQMTRKRVGQGLLEVFSEPCEHCRGRGIVVHTDPVDEKRRGGGASGGSGGAGGSAGSGGNGPGGGRRDQNRSETRESGRAETRDQNRSERAEAPAEAAEATADEPPAEGGEPRSGGRRNRGRRNRGQSGEERAAEDAAVLAAVGSDTAEAAAEGDAADGDAADAPADAAARETAPAAEETSAPGVPTDGSPADGSPAGAPGFAPEVLAEVLDVPVGAPSPDATPELPHEAAEAAVVPPVEAPVAPEAPPAPPEEEAADEDDVPAGAGPDEPAARAVLAGGRPRRRRAASRPAGPPAS
ncbi:Rne/Rng family ribonuclease [Trujillonella endophytica]|uniref:Ribonuclease E n=1 Tax=Trujillonella endophytica TaxID=673521 RepID=A0A1H8QZK4_9ACTN|nr:Rne/Rng family ribonuclease [Trujillella endophytica]SEO59294.1 ribonuclease E [Trujillella endophytica]